MNRMTSMNWGELPTFEAFKAAFERECPDGTYNVTPGIGRNRATEEAAGDHTAEELYALCDRMKDDYPEDPGDTIAEEESGERLVSDILYTLGFEWL